MSKKKILFIHHATSWGGAPINIFNIIKHLDTERFEPVFFLLRNCELIDYLKTYNISYQIAESKFYHKYYHPFGHLETSPTPWYKFFKYFKVILSWLLSRYIFAPRELKKLNYDIYHLNSSVLSDWLKPCKKRGKAVYHIQETILIRPKGRRYRFLRNQADKYADKIVAISDHTAKKIELPEKTSVVYNFSKLSKNKPKKASFYKKRVLFVGGHSKKKGFYLIVDALQYLDDDIKVFFAGKYRTESSKQWFKLISKKYRKKWEYLRIMKSSDKAIEIGLVPDIKRYLDECVCVVSPFTSPHFSRPVIEAYANYKPAIATYIDGIEEIVKTDKQATGIISKKKPYELAKAINTLCNKPEVALKMGLNGYSFAKETFSIENVKTLEQVYDAL